MGRTLRIVALLIVACSVGVVGVPSEAQTTRTLTVTPATDLADGDVVELHGTGFTPFSTVYFCQGVDDGTPGPEDCGGLIQSVPLDAAGGFVATYTVRRFISPGGAPVDCAQPSASCAIGSSDFFAPTPGFAFAPLNFTPLPPRTLTVTPDASLDDGEVVTVHGTGFTPSSPAYFCQTFTFAGPNDCGAPVQSVQSDAAGEFVASYTVQRFISPGGVAIDCALTQPGCVMGASDTFAGPGPPFAPLGFTPQPPQAITVTPDTDLVDGDAVTVHGVSFFPGSTVTVCQGVDRFCLGPTQAVEVDAAGDFAVTYTVQRFLTTSGLTRTDCAAPSASCSISYAGSTGGGLAPITFAPQPPLPQISGTVTDAQGTPVPGVDVWAYIPSDTWAA